MLTDGTVFGLYEKRQIKPKPDSIPKNQKSDLVEESDNSITTEKSDEST